MSARSRSVPWFGTLGERLERAEDEARVEDLLRDPAKALALTPMYQAMPKELRDMAARLVVDARRSRSRA